MDPLPVLLAYYHLVAALIRMPESWLRCILSWALVIRLRAVIDYANIPFYLVKARVDPVRLTVERRKNTVNSVNLRVYLP
jgi:hypothetical protein